MIERRAFRRWLLAAVATAAGNVNVALSQPAPSTTQPARVTVPTEPDPLRREVIENLLNLAAGPGRVADFHLPMDFLGCVADRILTAAFEEQFRRVVADGATPQPARPEATSRPTSRPAGESGVRVIQMRMSPEREALWNSWREDYPHARGFSVPLTLPGQQAQTLPAGAKPISMPFKQSMPGWRVSTESGESKIEGLHLQLSRGDDWLAYGDGGCIDIARQLAAALPKARMVASIERKHLADFLNEAADWKSRRVGETWALASPMPVAQWAQDNCKFGWVETDKPENRVRIALVPRYPSRGEAGAVFIPGEAAVLQGLAESGVARLVQSPLLFQAGNLICVWDAVKKKRLLLIGDAEVHRNVALGLSSSQVIDAFRIEFGVDQCVVLRAASFHIDYEVSVRNVNGRMVALVNDEQAAALLVLECGVDALVKAGDLTAGEGSAIKKAIAAGDPGPLEKLGAVLAKGSRGPGEFARSFAERFSCGPADSGVGNLQCFLRAMDIWSLKNVQAQGVSHGDATLASCHALMRRESDRATIRSLMKILHWDVAAIPSMGDSKRALNYLNGIHDTSRFFMPAYGGTFEKVDQAAQAAVRKAFGPSVEIVPVRCAESQRREGAVRCSAAVMYAPPSAP